MMYHPTIWQEIWVHFFIGIGLATAYAFYCQRHSHERHLFTFGDWPFGTQSKILEWLGIMLIVELIISWAPHQDHLYEMSMSIFEAPALVIGLWVVDRVAMILKE
jgi:hypothetical protein